jgi:hypothetical protein
VLSDRDRDTLHEIQCQLLAEDPRFTLAFDAAALRRRRQVPGLPRAIYTLVLLLSYLTLAVSVLIAGSISSTLAVAAVAAVTFEARRRHDNTEHER